MMIKNIKILYVLLLVISFSIYELFSPLTYPILLLLTGHGRFNDWWLTLGGITNYPKIVDGICTIPWIYAFILIKMKVYLGIFISYIIYILISLLIILPTYIELNKKFDKMASFLLIFSYPVLFGFWRGNSDFLIYGLILAAYFCGVNNKFSKSLIYIGSAIAFKPYQLFLLLAYKFGTLWKNLPVLIMGASLIIFLIYIANNNFFTTSYREMAKCGEWYLQEYAIGDGGTLHNNSLWGLFKLNIYYFYKTKENFSDVIDFFAIYLKIWPLLLIGIFFLLKPFVRIFDSNGNKFSTDFFLICLLIPILSPIVPDYRLFFINVCLIIAVTSNFYQNISSKFVISILIFILFPKEFLWFPLAGAWFTPNGALNCIAMLLLLCYLVFISAAKRKVAPLQKPAINKTNGKVK